MENGNQGQEENQLDGIIESLQPWERFFRGLFSSSNLSLINADFITDAGLNDGLL